MNTKIRAIKLTTEPSRALAETYGHGRFYIFPFEGLVVAADTVACPFSHVLNDGQQAQYRLDEHHERPWRFKTDSIYKTQRWVMSMYKIILSLVITFAPLVALADSAGQPAVTLPDPAVQVLIEQIGLRESPIASRDLPGWSPPKKIVVRPFRPGQLDEFRAIAPGVEFVEVDSMEAAIKEAADAQAIVGMCDEEILENSPGLFWIQVYSAGVERCVENPGMKKGNKLLTNGQRVGSPGLAEHAIAMMMMLARGLDVYHANQLKGVWQQQAGLERGDHMELEGRTLLVVGLGGIGTQVAKRGHGLGMRVIATRNSRREGPDYVEYVGLPDELNAVGDTGGRGDQHGPVDRSDAWYFQRGIFQGHEARSLFYHRRQGWQHGDR